VFSSRSMTDSGDTTMASAEAADPPFKVVRNPSKTKRLKAAQAQKIAVERTHSFTIRVYFPTPAANVKFNPITTMRAFLAELVKTEPSIVIVNPSDQSQLILSTDAIPAQEERFKQFFTISTDLRSKKNQQHVIIGCHMLAERTMKDIKFDKTRPQFMNWIDNAKVFIESDTLGVNKTTTIGYITKVHPLLTSRTTLKALLESALETIVIDPTLAVELDPTLKEAQQNAKTNGDFFNPELPPFEIYKTKLVHGRDKEKVETNVLGVKSTIQQARLLKEFFSQLASPDHYENQIGVFVPTGAVHLLGATNYATLIRDNNAFIHSVVSIPIGDFQHASLDIPFSLDSSTDIDMITLQDLIAEQSWCLSVDKTATENKVMILTTKTQLATARNWVDTVLPRIYSQCIQDKLDVTTLRNLLPRRLDKPVLTVASSAYAEKLKIRTTASNAPTATTKHFAKPPRARKTPHVGMTFEDSEYPALVTATSTQTATTTAPPPQATSAIAATATPAPPYDYKAEMARITAVIENDLKQQFAALFTTMEQRIEKLITQQAANYAEQQKVNATNSQQLGWVVDQLKLLLQHQSHGSLLNSPLPMRGNGQS